MVVMVLRGCGVEETEYHAVFGAGLAYIIDCGTRRIGMYKRPKKKLVLQKK
jgi:hypothetical protein